MSTLPKRALSTEADGGAAMQPFPYEQLTDAVVAGEPAPQGEPTAASADTLSARESATYTRGLHEGQASAQKQWEEQLATERSSLAAALSQFTRDRASYFEKVEGEVVQLALSIARKILHREAQVDPLLLAGVVRVALEKIESATGVLLRVHPSKADEWRRYLSLRLPPADLPQIVDDASQAPDTCVLETAMGRAVLGLEVQLKEIEAGLMDLLAARPGLE
ncbi:MAG TPA: FliH/SctL family protein [Dongiaceae bacterium]|nr:FliH/SctL family protein [Dongiaceae bacterium]